MDDTQFSMLLEYFSFSWAGYRKVRKGVKKRISRHLNELRCRDMDAYIQVLESDPAHKRTCERLLTVPISRFFRDRVLWEALEENILPAYLGQECLNVWSAGCSGGEEVYSFKIIWEILKQTHGDLPNLTITACDLNPENLDRARKGVYTPSSFKGADPDLYARYFEKGPTRKSLAIRSFLKQGICWEVFDLLADHPPANVYDIIFLRNNILTYAAEDLRLAAFNKVISGLADAGILIIGAKERLPVGSAGFAPLELPYVFQRKDSRIKTG